MAKRPRPVPALIAVPAQPAKAAVPAQVARTGMTISGMARARGASVAPRQDGAESTWRLPVPLPGVLPRGEESEFAMDSNADLSAIYEYADAYYEGRGEGIRFLGFPILSELSQRPEYRRMVGTLAQEMTRKFIRLTSSGCEDKSEKLGQIDAEFKRLRVREVFRELAEHDGFFGRAQLFFDTGHYDDPIELRSPLTPTPEKLPIGGLKGLRAIEAIWTYPDGYNGISPLAPDFYKPMFWFVMGTRVHRSRLVTMVSRDVPDMLKPLYMFGGISLVQLAKPYVDAWLRVKEGVTAVTEAFTIWILKTNLSATLGGGSGEDMAERAQLFNNYKSSRGLMIVDNETEDLENVSTPLGGLDHLQAQAQEHLASVDGMPLIKLLGITPSGLNATAEPEMRAWYDRVRAQQQHLFGVPLHLVLEYVQMSLFGEIDPDIGYEFEGLGEIDEGAKAGVRKTEAETAVILINAGVLAPQEERARLAGDGGSIYSNLDVSEEIAPPGEEDDDGEPGQDDDESTS